MHDQLFAQFSDWLMMREQGNVSGTSVISLPVPTSLPNNIIPLHRILGFVATSENGGDPSGQ